MPRLSPHVETLLRGLVIQGLFWEIVSRDPNGHVEVNKDEVVKVIALLRSRISIASDMFSLTWDIVWPHPEVRKRHQAPSV